MLALTWLLFTTKQHKPSENVIPADTRETIGPFISKALTATGKCLSGDRLTKASENHHTRKILLLTHMKEFLQDNDSIELTVAPILNVIDDKNRAFVAICQGLPLFVFVIWSMEAVTPARKAADAINI